MKKVLYLLLALLLPIFALADEPAAPVSDLRLPLPGENPAIADCIPLSGGGALLNVLTTDPLAGVSMDMFYLIRINAAGETLWQTRYHAFSGVEAIDRYSLSLSGDSVTVTLYADLIGNEHCTQTSMIFDLATGRQDEEIDVFSIPADDVPTITHSGDFRIEEYFGDYSGETTRTLITYIPTGRTAEYELDGQRTYHAFGDKLMCFRSGMQDGGRYWVFDANCLPIIEAAETPFGSVNPMVGHSAQGKDVLYLFVWTNRENPDQRTYTVFPVDEDLKIGEAITSFTLEEGHTLGAAAACGDGFLFTESHPWEWQQPARNALSCLSKDGTLTVLAPDISFPRNDSAHLLPGAEEGHALVILRDEADAVHHLRTYAAK